MTIELKHVKGEENIADMLSRHVVAQDPDDESIIEENEQVVLSLEDDRELPKLAPVSPCLSTHDVIKALLWFPNSDPSLTPNQTRWLKNNLHQFHWDNEKNLLRRGTQTVPTLDEAINILKFHDEHHLSPKNSARFADKFWWYGCVNDHYRYSRTCQLCQSYGPRSPDKKTNKLRTIDTPLEPFLELAIDVVKLPKSSCGAL